MDSLIPRSFDLSETRQPNLYAATIVPGFFALVCVSLRFWSRWTNRAGFWLDDWLIVCALEFLRALTSTGVPRALGKHIQTFGPNVVEDMFIGLFACELTYTGVIVFVKLSILALYWRIFSKTNIKLPIAILSTFVLMWGVAVFLLTLLQCIPTRGFWDKTIQSSCNVDSQKFLFSISIPNILLDVALLALPAPYVMSLHIPTSQKRALVSIFTLGGFVCIASIMRLIAVVNQKEDADMTWNLIGQATWAVVEVNFAVISACLPTMRPVWLAIRKKSRGTKLSEDLSYQHAANSASKQLAQPSSTTEILSSHTDDEDRQLYSNIPGPRGNGSQYGLAGNPYAAGKTVAIPLPTIQPQYGHDPGAIRVENEWDVEYSQRNHRQEM
ncbi:hypothetical protein LA080_011425 [Diaporthe eres]|nr:hypothetical protein LA080_011425 [Diaporthe eres]